MSILRARFAIVSFIVLLLPLSASAATEFYLDPNVSGGTQVGTTANPWNALTSSAWSAINSALNAGDVTVYCSARSAGSDTNQAWGATVTIADNKTPNPAGTLTFDGHSKWNSNDTSPSWASYTGSSRCAVAGFDAQNSSHIKYNKVVIDGFVVVRTGGAKAVAVCGDSWTVQNSDISHASGASGGPLVMVTPSADSAREGSGSWCPAMTKVVFQDNVIHDSYGELMYIGAAGCSLSASAADAQSLRTDNGACNGLPSHSDITIQRNTLYNCGSRGAQGDCIDLKAGLSLVTIRQNNISNNKNDNNFRCIVSQGTTPGTDQRYVIERNNIHDCLGTDDAAVAFSDSWGIPNGIEIRNNLITGATAGYGIKAYTTQSLGLRIYNNTLYNNGSGAIETSSGSTVTIKNNALLNNNGGGTQSLLSGSVVSDHNAYNGSWGGTCTSCLAGLTAAAFTNVSSGNFSLAAGSNLINNALTLTTFSNDYLGQLRPTGWAIGAYDIGTTLPPPPAAPSQLRIIR